MSVSPHLPGTVFMTRAVRASGRLRDSGVGSAKQKVGRVGVFVDQRANLEALRSLFSADQPTDVGAPGRAAIAGDQVAVDVVAKRDGAL